ncbi:MAG: hypothetical protein LBE24_00025 [Methylobacillus sp.]|jgi:hypothetical protein|nr:hypothetical protein [Methylobacillus sp.]
MDENTGKRQLFSGEQEYEAALDRVIASAQKTLHVFDIDFTRGGWSSMKRCEQLQDFLRRQHVSQSEPALIIVLHEVAWLTAHCPRLVNLLRVYSHAMTIYQTTEAAHVATNPFVIADQQHYVHRLHFEHPRSVLALDDPSGASGLEGRFREILEVSYSAVSATTLGL